MDALDEPRKRILPLREGRSPQHQRPGKDADLQCRAGHRLCSHRQPPRSGLLAPYKDALLAAINKEIDAHAHDDLAITPVAKEKALAEANQA